MVWLIVVVALVALGFAAWAGTGRFGAMPAVVNDSPRPVIPPGPVDQDFLDALELPRAAHGYDTQQVLTYLQGYVDGETTEPPWNMRFTVVRHGLAMPATDLVMARIEEELSQRVEPREETLGESDGEKLDEESRVETGEAAPDEAGQEDSGGPDAPPSDAPRRAAT